jgi:ribosome-associated heat shock protein Hsp15
MEAMSDENQRLDRWLWSVRFFKTRGLAVDAIKNGRVNVNGARAKPAKMVKTGDLIHIQRPPYVHKVEVLGLTARRVSANRARELYVETEDSIAAREALRKTLDLDRVVEQRRWGQLNKKERRERERFKRNLD